MAHHVARGDWVGCVVLTHGARVHDEVISEQMFHRDVIPEADELRATMRERADVKEQETRAACAALGVEHIVFFGADDAVLLVTEEVVRRLARVLRELRPDVVLTHFPKEDDGITNPHAITGQIVMYALRLASSVDPGDRNPPHRTAQVFYFGIGAAATRHGLWDQTGGYACDVFVDITDVAEKEARRAGRAGQPGLRRRLRAQADRDLGRRLRPGGELRLRRGVHLPPPHHPLLSAGHRSRPAPRPRVRPRGDGVLFVQAAGLSNSGSAGGT